MNIGELFVLGFRGTHVPLWLKKFAERFGLGGVILFDFDFQKKCYGNNIQSKEQLKNLCAEIHSLPTRPMVLVDQEGGKVRRLKEALGFAPLCSAKDFALRSVSEQEKMLRDSFSEMVALGIDLNLAPVVDLDLNPKNPDLGAIGRCYSSDEVVLNACVERINKIATEQGLQLCLKHYPGLGGATTNSHQELTDLSGKVPSHQIDLFVAWGAKVFGSAILVSHGLVKEWENQPVSLSKVAIEALRGKLPEVLLISDDLQMQGLQAFHSTEIAIQRAFLAGLDWVIVGNNLMDEEAKCWGFAEQLERQVQGEQWAFRLSSAHKRIHERKKIAKFHFS